MKLDQDVQDAINNDEGQEGGDFEALEEGYYLAKIESIKLSDKPGKTGHHQWVLVWRIVAPKAARNRTVWDRLSLSPKAAWKMRELFDALGFEYDSDSDELVGEQAILELSQEVIPYGKREGEMGNNVEKVIDPEDADMKKLVGK